MTIEEIKKEIQTPQYDFLKTNPHLGDKIILLGLGGSHAYGTNIKTSDLAINGRDLIEIGVPEGKLIGKILNLCLAYVIDGTVDNTREELFKVANMLFTANPTLYIGGQTND